MKKYAVIVAGGSGIRMGNQLPKQFLLLGGKPVLWHTLTVFLESFEDLEIILVLPTEYMETGKTILSATSAPHRVHLTSGGITRFHSVKNGLARIPDGENSIVFVHDGVRCLITKSLIHRCYEKAVAYGNAVPAIASVDSIRLETPQGNQLIDRDKIRIIQTPQTFYSEVIKNAFEQEFQEFFTDEASVVERAGGKINLVEGESSNIKITRPVDLLIAESILVERKIRPKG
ncbi:2-C-methyl-D-erythritol 4-phosphate cytidylyltransferase [Flavitalea flava]